MPLEMRSIVVLFALVVPLLPVPGQRLVPPKKYHSEDDEAPTLPDEDDEELEGNSTGELMVDRTFKFTKICLKN